MAKTRLEYLDSTSHKFWEITAAKCSYTVRYGRVGSKGQTKDTSFASSAQASAGAKRLIAAKRKKGYTDVSVTKKGGKVSAPLSSAPPPKLPANKVALVQKRIAPYVGAQCGYFRGGEFFPVLIFDWSKIKAAQKTRFWDGLLGDVESADSFPGVVDVDYEELPRGRGNLVKPRWRTERWLPFALDAAETYRFSDMPQFHNLLCADLAKATAKSIPVYSIGVSGTLATQLEKTATDLNKLAWKIVTPIKF